MPLRHDPNDANLSRIGDDLIGVRELLEKMDHAQDALLENGLTKLRALQRRKEPPSWNPLKAKSSTSFAVKRSKPVPTSPNSKPEAKGAPETRASAEPRRS